ncbi:MAG: hypothetical protein FJZ95_01510 [Chloroflexi bacterium]|nr:hypothetical protein [Chloroflexota bacterium]
MDDDTLFMLVRGTSLDSASDFFIDADNNGSTGFHSYLWPGSGIDYLIENGNIYEYTGDGSSWSWTYLSDNTTEIKTNTIVEISLPLSAIGLSEPREIKISYQRAFTDNAPVPGNAMVTLYPYG